MAPFIGEFDVDPETIEEGKLPPAKVNVVLLVKKAERRVAPNSGNSFIGLTLEAVDLPGAGLYHSYFLTSKALAARSSAISFKKFLEKVKLPYTTTAQDLINFRFVAQLRHKGEGDEAQAEVDTIVGPVLG